MMLESLDKSMLEAMTCGCYPVVTRRNADFVQRHAERPPMPPDRLFEIIRAEHGLDALIAKLDADVRPGR